MPTRRRSRATAGHDVNAFLARYVPITRAMGIRLRSFDASGVTMTAPLKPNINDKGIAFGGTLASMLALSGWALTDLLLREAGEAADVLIASGATEYRAPVTGRIVARCPPPPPADLSAFLAAYRLRGKARLRLKAFIEGEPGPAALFEAVYLARRSARTPQPAREDRALAATPGAPAPLPRSCSRTPPPSGRSRSAPSAQR